MLGIAYRLISIAAAESCSCENEKPSALYQRVNIVASFERGTKFLEAPSTPKFAER